MKTNSKKINGRSVRCWMLLLAALVMISGPSNTTAQILAPGSRIQMANSLPFEIGASFSDSSSAWNEPAPAIQSEFPVIGAEATCGCQQCGCQQQGCSTCSQCQRGGCRARGGKSCGRQRCPKCECEDCVLVAAPAEVTKVCFQTEQKLVCIPKVRLPWQQCCPPTRAKSRVVNTLKLHAYQCPTCSYTWTDKVPASQPASDPAIATPTQPLLGNPPSTSANGVAPEEKPERPSFEEAIPAPPSGLKVDPNLSK